MMANAGTTLSIGANPRKGMSGQRSGQRLQAIASRLVRLARIACVGAFSWAATAAPAAETAHLQVELGSHAGAVRRIAVDPGRDLVATGADDKTARLWALAEGELRRVLRPPVGADEVGRVYGVALHPQRPWVALGGSLSATGAPAIHVYDSGSGDPLRRFDAGTGEIKRLLWTRDGSLLVAGFTGGHGVRAFDLEGREVFADAFDSAVYALAVAPGLLAAAALDGTLRVYAQADPGPTPRFTELWRTRLDANPVSLAFSPAADALAVGYFAPGRVPDVVDLRSRRVTAGATPPALARGTLMSVAWSADGRRVYAAGDYPFARRNTRLVAFEPGARTADEIETGAPSTVTDLVTLADGRVAFASADGSWGVLDTAARRTALRRAGMPDLDGAVQLRVSADGRVVSWTLDAGRDRVSFDLGRRLVSPGAAEGLLPPLLRRGLFDTPAQWENHRQPQVNGAAVALAPDEVSRAVALFANTRDAVLGTSRALYRLGPGGAVLWRRQMNTEVRAVNVTPDGRLIHAAMLDGTIRIARASDGRELLALLMLKDRRWVLWTPDGHFDASVGADRLVGWVVNRANGSAADHYPAAQFRERYHLPRRIDLLLETLDADTAARRHGEEMAAEAGSIAPPPAAPTAVAAVVPRLPPVMQSPLHALELKAPTAESEVEAEVPVTVHSEPDGGALDFEVRIDGRPGELVGAAVARDADGLARGRLRLRVPASALSVQLLARNANGASAAWALVVRTTLPTLATLAPTVAPLAPVNTAPLPASPAPLPAAPGAAAASPALQDPFAGPARGLGAAGAARPQAGRLFVLTVGVSAYQRQQYRLRLAAKDAADFGRAIQAQHGKLYREVVVRALLDQQATRANVLAALGWLARAGGKGDTFMVFMAGHGVTSAAGSYHFLPVDARHEDLAGTAVTDRELRNALRQVPGRTLLFIDTCHAGAVLGATSGRNSELARFVNEMSDNGVVVFAASSGRQESLEHDDWGNGAFTSALLEGLGGKADPFRAGRVTYKGLDYFVSEEVQRLTQGRQTPVSLSPYGVPDFELARL